MDLSEDSQEETDGMSEDSTSVVLDDFSEDLTAGFSTLLEFNSGEIPLFGFSALEDFFELSTLEEEEEGKDINYRNTFL